MIRQRLREQVMDDGYNHALDHRHGDQKRY